MSELKDNENKVTSDAVENDPLAELARLVSSGSIFGETPAVTPQPTPPQEPVLEAQQDTSAPEPADDLELMLERELDLVAEEPTRENTEPAIPIPVEATLPEPVLEQSPEVVETPPTEHFDVPLPESAPELSVEVPVEPENRDLDSLLGEQLEAELAGSAVEENLSPEVEVSAPPPQLAAHFDLETENVEDPFSELSAIGEDKGVAETPESNDVNLDPISSFIQEEIAKAQQDLIDSEAESKTQPPQSFDPIYDSNGPSASTATNADTAIEDALSLEALLGSDEPKSNIETELPQPTEFDLKQPSQPEPFEASVSPSIDLGTFEADLFADGLDVSEPELDAAPTPDVIESFKAHGDVEPQVDAGADFAVNDDMVFDEQGNEDKSAKKSGILLAVVGVLVLTLFGSVAYLIFGGSDGSDPVVVAADSGPARVKPDDPGGKVIPNQDNVVYDTIANEGENGTTSGLQDDGATRVILGNNQSTDQPRIVLPGSDENSDATVSATRPNLGPKTVKTVIIRPDGTPVLPDEDDVVASNSGQNDTSGLGNRVLLPVDDGSPATPSVDTQPLAVTVEETSNANNELPTSLSPTDDNQPVEVVAVGTPAPNAPVPRFNTFREEFAARREAEDRLAELRQEQQSRQVQQQPTAIQPTSTAAPAATGAPAVGTGNWLVQLSSQRTVAQAQTTFDNLRRRFPVLNNYQPNIRQADLGDRGIFHRVRVGPFSNGEANTLCNQLKSSGGDCILTTN